MHVSYLVLPGVFPESIQPAHLGTRKTQPVDNVPHQAMANPKIFTWSPLSAFFSKTLQVQVQSSAAAWFNIQLYNQNGDSVYFNQWFCNTGKNDIELETENMGNGKYFIELTEIVSGKKILRSIVKGAL